MNKLVSFLLYTLSLGAGFFGGGLIMAAPTASVATTPGGTTSGGSGVLIPWYEATGVLDAKVDNGQSPGGSARLAYNNTDDATAKDLTQIEGTVANPTNKLKVEWRAIVEFSGEAYVETINAPGNPNSGTYKTTSTVTVWCQLDNLSVFINRTSTEAPTISQNTTGTLTSTASMVFAANPGLTPLEPLVVAGAGSDFHCYLSYYIECKGLLRAKRDGVIVGGYAKRKNAVSGTYAAWNVTDTANPTIMKKPDGTDAVWNLQ